MSNKKRLLITLFGSVQGVGFRPFVYRLAVQYGLSGHIRNTSRDVSIDVQGESEALDHFQRDLKEKKPKRACISEMKVWEAALSELNGFKIISSDRSEETDLVLLPDTSICMECLQELRDPQNRRYRYPFLHCMSCGPRFSLFARMPFDREHTSMVDFPMCNECLKEYGDPGNRRFYSQTNCCPTCGPTLTLFDSKQNVLASHQEAIAGTIDALLQGKIVAMKNTGGYLLLVDATNDAAIQRLRLLKQRLKKPFAVLMGSVSEAKRYAFIDLAAEEVLISPASPIVLLKKRAPLAPSIAFQSPYMGVMLAHNALQTLLLDALKRPLVATSGNLSGRPLCATEEEAFNQLFSVADLFLVHNRRIMHRLDDSIVQIIDERPMMIRRARGYIPYAIELPETLYSSECILGVGGHQKNSFALSKNQRIYLSQYMGDLDSLEACTSYEDEVESWNTLLNASPEQGVGDFHPGYYTTLYLQERKIPSTFIQHHKAHVYSGMLDNPLSPPFLSISWDGTGLGDDQTIWGGEAFIMTEKGALHFGTLSPFRLPGAEKAVKEPRRALMGVLHAIFGVTIPPLNGFRHEEFQLLCDVLEKKINAPICSSMGRLFDAVSALLNCCTISQFEGEAALALETLACRAEEKTLEYALVLKLHKNIWTLEWQDLIKQMLKDQMMGISLAEMAYAFHRALAKGIVQLAQKTSLTNVLLTGGCMQNKLLLEMAIQLLREAGFNPFWHHQIPPNDGGLSVGQIMGKLLTGEVNR